MFPFFILSYSPCLELHKQVEDGACWPEFYALFQQLPLEHMDLATRWTDWFQQTLLFRSVQEFALNSGMSMGVYSDVF